MKIEEKDCMGYHSGLCRCFNREGEDYKVISPTLMETIFLWFVRRFEERGVIGTGISQWLARKLFP